MILSKNACNFKHQAIKSHGIILSQNKSVHTSELIIHSSKIKQTVIKFELSSVVCIIFRSRR